MAGPSWLAGTLAAAVILVAAYSACRIIFASLRGLATETDADALHAVMGTAMAGMLAPQLNLMPGRAWTAVFALAAAWFGWHAIRGRGPLGACRCRYPVPHLVECATMIYMLQPAASLSPAHEAPGMTMPGMGTSTSFPALAAVLTLFMIGYIIWTTDHLATLARTKTSPAGPAPTRGRLLVSTAAAAAPSQASAASAPPAAADTPIRYGSPARQPMLAPKLAACCKIAMSVAMGYMLILMF